LLLGLSPQLKKIMAGPSKVKNKRIATFSVAGHKVCKSTSVDIMPASISLDKSKDHLLKEGEAKACIMAG
jgi:hypothetical protein